MNDDNEFEWQDVAIELKKKGLSTRAISRHLYGTDGKRNKLNRFFKRDDVQTKLNSINTVGNISDKVKFLYYDIETTLAVSYHFRQWKVDLPQKQKIKESHLLAHAWAWNNDEVQSSILTVDEVLKSDPERLVLEAWALFDNADIICAHNSKKFDIKKVNAYFLQYGLPPPSHYKVIDTLQIAKQMFNLPFNSLAYLAEFLGVEQKIDTGGVDLWIGCDRGDQDSLDKMQEYNEGDITTLRAVHQKLIGWSNNGVNIALYNKDHDVLCTHCGSDNIQVIEGKVATTVQRQYQLYRCHDCGALQRDRHYIVGASNKLNRVI